MAQFPGHGANTQESGFRAFVRESFEKQQVMQTLGARLTRVLAGEVEIELPYREALTQQHGFTRVS
jgi:acyl-coenzyme A thioesterase PaaI-like protein